jgi:subtilisin family serine protease
MKLERLLLSGLNLCAGLALALAGTFPAVAASAKAPTARVAGELLVGLRAGVSPNQAQGLFRGHGATVIDEIGPLRIVRIRVPAPAEDAIAQRLVRLPQVKFVEKNYIFDPVLLPNDPQYAGQWHLPQILAPQAWDLTLGAPGVVIAIVDSGVDPNHPDLASKLVAGYNTYSNNTITADSYGHGTEVAGAAAALTNNAEGIAGVAGLSPLMPVRVTDATGRATSATIANGLVWAADHGAKVLNLSFNGVAGNATIRTAAEYAFNHGGLVVAASGNCGCVDATAENPFILSVSATDETDAVAYFSSTGPFVDLSAPGTNILTTAMGGLYFSDSGTSLASPIVAGVAALMFSANSALTPLLVTQLLEMTAVDFGGTGYDRAYGFGRVNAYAAVTAAAGYTPPPDTTPPVVSVTSPVAGAAVSGTAIVDVSATDNVGVVQVDLYVDGVLFATDTSAPYSFAWDTTAAANGSHTLLAVAADAAGNSASTTPVTVTVSNIPPDTAPPSVAISTPSAGATVSGTTTVAVGATDNVGVVKVDLYVDGALFATDTSAPYSFAWDTKISSNGSHTLQAVATDAAGNAATATVTVTVNNVNQAPIAANDSVTAPYRSGNGYTPQVFAVLANDRDPDGTLNVASVTIVRAPNKGGTVTVNANGTVSYTPKKGYRGTETCTYNVKDNKGATSNTATVTVTVQ